MTDVMQYCMKALECVLSVELGSAPSKFRKFPKFYLDGNIKENKRCKKDFYLINLMQKSMGVFNL